MKTANSSNQFRVVVTGNMEYPEDHNDYGTYFKRSEILLCCADSLAKAMECVAEAWSKNQWKFREDKDYFDPDLGKDCGPINFLPEIILIKDKNEKLVLTGHAADLKWFQKGTPEERQRAIFEKNH
ncbi:hypothetical protein [Mixta intestinalis]|uniref:Uncharacterized protein n=1 Tax=Mixta intestinalis TaxID=1615494 RepID=A0A6P1Q7U4_9GAMM|nr:hypothetical protein [Mixta intestinalis]QHM74038.1 hypothetical protein C7M51_04399 [Mixta intestinalis]